MPDYSCLNPKCGQGFTAVPPDDIHVEAKRTPCEKGDSFEVPYECPNCYFENKIYWDLKHGAIVFKKRNEEKPTVIEY